MFERNALGANARKTKIQLSSYKLKMIAAVLTMVGTFGIAILQNGIMNLENYSTKTLLEALTNDARIMGLTTVIVLCGAVSALALPIYALMLIEGFKHTSSVKKYIIRVAVLAVISEIPYDLAIRDKWFDMSSQNPVFSILIALVMIYFLNYFDQVTRLKGKLFKLLIIIAALMWSVILCASSGFVFILLTAVLWLMEGSGALTTFVAIIVSLFQFPAPFGLLFNYFYNGEKGSEKRIIFYIIYPVQLLVMGLIGKFLF